MGLLFKNNFKALLIHVFVGLLSVVAYITFFTAQYKWNNEAAYRRHELLLTAGALAVILSALLLYYFGCMLLIKSTGRNLRNMFSVSGIAVIGLIWWLCSSVLVSSKSSLMNYHTWFYYCLYNSYGLPLIHIMNIDNIFIYLIFPVMPSLVMGIALIEKEMKHRKLEKRKEQIEKELVENKASEDLKANYEKEEKEKYKDKSKHEKKKNNKEDIKENIKENKNSEDSDLLEELVNKEVLKKRVKKRKKITKDE